MRVLLIAGLFIIGLNCCSAQTLSLRTGANLAWQSWQQQGVTVTPKKIIGPHIGISVTNMQLKNLASQIEIGYSIYRTWRLFRCTQ